MPRPSRRLEGFAQKWFTQQLPGHVGRGDTVASLASCAGFPGLQSVAGAGFPTAFGPPSRTPDAAHRGTPVPRPCRGCWAPAAGPPGRGCRSGQGLSPGTVLGK